MTRAALGVADLVEREQDFCHKSPALGQHGLDHVGRSAGEPRQVEVTIERDDMIEHEARVANRRRILRHKVDPLLTLR